jgi:hypothetical protein
VNPDSALAFLRQLTEWHVREGQSAGLSSEYIRGGCDLAERYALYIEALRDDPESDRAVAA